MAAKRTMKLASRGKRFGAACIDAVIPFIIYILFMIAVGMISRRSMPMQDFGYGFEDDFGYGYGYGYGYEMNTAGRGTGTIIAVALLMLLAYCVVQCIFFVKSKSIGKAMLGMQVVSSRDGNPIGFWRMILREWIVKQADNVLLLGYIWILIDDKNRGWHDKILDTYVVDLKESEKIAVRRSRENEDAAAYRADKMAASPAPAPARPEAAPAVTEAAAAPAVTEVIVAPPKTEAIAAPAMPGAIAAPAVEEPAVSDETESGSCDQDFVTEASSSPEAKTTEEING